MLTADELSKAGDAIEDMRRCDLERNAAGNVTLWVWGGVDGELDLDGADVDDVIEVHEDRGLVSVLVIPVGADPNEDAVQVTVPAHWLTFDADEILAGEAAAWAAEYGRC